MSLDRFRKVKYYIGAMSANSVDAILSMDDDIKSKIGFISSRRQIDCSGGYVNNWSTKSFKDYVRSKDKNFLLCRDHGGPDQGTEVDDGLESFIDDSEHLDIIHVDPWKKYQNLQEGSEITVSSILSIYEKNPRVFFEVGTEEAIRKFNNQDLLFFLNHLQENLSEEIFKKIVYCVVQSGVGLDLGSQLNTGKFDKNRLSEMIDICKDFGLLTKEHNSDYLNKQEMEKRFACGLDSANIAPEMGQIETRFYIKNFLKKDQELFEKVYNLCLDSRKWEKWVSSDFNPEVDRERLVLICGHYIFSHDHFPISLSANDKLLLWKTLQNKINSLIS